MKTEKILNAAGNKNLAKEFGNLVFLGNVTEEPYTTDEIVAAYSDNSVHAIKNIIYNHKRDFEDLGFCHLK